MTVTGRGAWTRVGGTTPYYELIKPRIGKAAASDPSLDTDAIAERAVYYGVFAIQARLKELGYRKAAPNGIYTWWTAYRVKQFQKAAGLVADGVVGSSTAKKLFGPVVARYQTVYSLPVNLLGGVTTVESLFDPGAVGYGTPGDKGLDQFNTVPPNNTTWWNVEPVNYNAAMAFDYKWAVEEAARRMLKAKSRYSGKGEVLRNKCLALQHNSPLWADKLYNTGKYPTPEAETYVSNVFAAAKNF